MEPSSQYPDAQDDPAAALAAVQARLATATFGRTAASQWLGVVDSTNRVAREAAAAGAPEGTLVVAEQQSAGRGRRGRGWVAPYGSSLLLSLLLRPPRATPLGLLPFVAAVALAETVAAQTGLALALKWPNDLLLDGLKVGGILAESEWAGGGPATVVVGVGVNVNTTAADLAALDIPATSLAVALGRPVDRMALLAEFLVRWEAGEQARRAGRSPLPAWRRYAALLGQPVTVYPATGDPWPAVALDVTDEGALRVRDAHGCERLVHAADVSIRATGAPTPDRLPPLAEPPPRGHP